MNRNTNIANVIDGNAYKSQYDAEAKRVLADKSILARIMKYSVKEFGEYPVEMIRDCIEGEPEIGIHRVLAGHAPESITGINTEDGVSGEGLHRSGRQACEGQWRVTWTVGNLVFRAVKPQSEERDIEQGIWDSNFCGVGRRSE